MSNSARFALYQWSPAWELPSSDPHCLIIQAYMQFSELEYRALSCDTPEMSSCGLPVLQDDDTVLEGVPRIIKFLKEKARNLDEHLNEEQLFEMESIPYTLQDLEDARLYEWWAVPDNFATTRKLYAHHVFPLHWLVPFTTKLRTGAQLRERGATNTDQIYDKAARVYEILSKRLGQSQYFFGNSPSTIDAYVFGHLAVHLYAPLPAGRLSTLLSKHANLIAFVRRVLINHFHLVPRESVSLKSLLT